MAWDSAVIAEGRGAFLRVGLLLVAGAALLVGLVLFLGGQRFQHGKIFETYFSESVQGLDVGSPVKYRGVTLGQVTDIGLVYPVYGKDQPQDVRQATYREVFVRFMIDTSKAGDIPETEQAVKSGLRARLAQQGITGLAYLELDFVSPRRFPAQTVPWQPKDAYIPSMPSTIAQVQDAAQVLIGRLEKVDVDKLAEGLTGLVEDLRGELKDGQMHQTLADASALLKVMREGVQQADLPGLSAQVRQTVASVDSVTSGKQMKDIMGSAASAAERFSAAAARLQPLLASLEATVRNANNGAADIQATLAPVLQDTRAAVANLRETTEALRRDPGQLLFSAPPPRTRDRSR